MKAKFALLALLGMTACGAGTVQTATGPKTVTTCTYNDQTTISLTGFSYRSVTEPTGDRFVTCQIEGGPSVTEFYVSEDTSTEAATGTVTYDGFVFSLSADNSQLNVTCTTPGCRGATFPASVPCTTATY